MESHKISDLISLKKNLSIVTGGSGHLGSAISEALAELGSDIIIIGSNEDKGKKFAQKIKDTFNVDAIFDLVDINSYESIDKYFNQKKPKASILINNAFTWPSIPKVEETSWNDFEHTVRSGITSPFYFTKLATEFMKQNSKGAIINIGSMYGMISPNFKIYHNKPNMGNALAYNAAKAAIIQMTKYMAVHYAPWNIRVNCISPGPFPHPGTFNDKEWFEKELKDMNPMKKLGEPWQLKGAVALFATELGSYITGQNLPIDGGWTIW